MFTLTPLDRRFFPADPEHVTLGLSPWNGRYKTPYIKELVTWAYRRFGRLDVFVPGYEAAHTLVAGGYPVGESVHRARRAINRLRNPSVRALAELGVADPASHVRTWTQLHNRPAYVHGLELARQAYESDPEARAACRATAHGAISRLEDHSAITDAHVDLAVGYAIAELPLVLHGPEIYGVKSTLFLYHRDMELLHPFLRPGAFLPPAPGQGYAIVTDQDGGAR
ncbi:tRNA-dependent cyclodipeptide synthase [Amycolatopsis sp. PS_44_ISF1]|uniref:tRNA-dependent cyclodipeptide synthase n=1 Tax=Amycolatopsis sp. PS_44_ISF1 TaxID=2974917 RepID=UPI0028DE6684|nr:tRNA-dependent cyclodipeptide synthase [Amycolatopsis sp. PS_44_ISF1]MDT8914502.1 tRNA-dependent cyclodipeptide synthase [Amycolatopsis sp. PS_44_ISF1]